MPGPLSPTASLDHNRGVLVYDVNAPWREKVFEALGSLRPVVGIAPQVGWRGWHNHSAGSGDGRQIGYRRLEITVLPGWARKLYPLHRPYFWQRGVRALKSCGIAAMVITIPHHWPLLLLAEPGMKRIYYCPDYYQAYEGWNPDWVRNIETGILSEADAVITVSEALRRHFISLIPEAARKIWVVPNGVDSEFLSDQPAVKPIDLPLPGVKFQRPLLGCVGVFNSRVDYRLLRRVVDREKHVWLALVGPLEPLSDKVLEEERNLLLAHPRVITVGRQPHESLPTWLRAMDVLLIPYTKSKFNYMCSPMRLFDYLASGRPIVGTSACRQLLDYQDVIKVEDGANAFCFAVSASIKTIDQESMYYKRWAVANDSLWSMRATKINDILNSL